MLMQSPHGSATTITKRHNLVDREIACLTQKRKSIFIQLTQYQNRNKNLQGAKRELFSQRHILTTIEIDLDKIQQNLQLLQDHKNKYEEEKLQYIIMYEDMEIHCEHLAKDLVKCFQYQISDFDQIKLQMIDVENSQCLKNIEQLFSIRKSTILFLKDKALISKKYPFGVQMEICRLKFSEEFGWFLKAWLKQIGMDEVKEVTDCIDQYTILAKKCQKILASIDQNLPKVVKQDESLKRQQITESIMKDRDQIMKTQQKIHKLTSKISQISKRLEQYSSFKSQRLKDKKQTTLLIQMLQQKIKCLQIIQYKQQQLKQQLRQINEAIEYLYSKNLNFENSRSQLNISLRSGSRQRNQMNYPYSYSEVSIPRFCESIVKSEVVTTPKNKLNNFSTVKKPLLRIQSRSKNKKRLNSPSWK